MFCVRGSGRGRDARHVNPVTSRTVLVAAYRRSENCKSGDAAVVIPITRCAVIPISRYRFIAITANRPLVCSLFAASRWLPQQIVACRQSVIALSDDRVSD